MPRSISLITALFLMTSALQGQPEKIFVHFDKPFYLAGEIVRYKAIFIQSGDSTPSAILRTEWIAPTGKSLGVQRLLIEGRGAEGSFQIPENAVEGYYTFRAYTLRDLNYDPEFVFQTVVTVLNDAADAPAEGNEEVENQAPAIKTAASRGMKIEAGKARYARREKASVSITLTDAAGRPTAGEVSVSIIDAQKTPFQLFSEKTILETAAAYTGLNPAPSGRSFSTERNMELWGVIKDPATGKTIRQNYLSLYAVEDKTFRRFSTLNGDTVRASVPYFYGSRTIQALCFNPNFPNVLLWEPAEPGGNLPAVIASSRPQRSVEMDRFLRQERLRRKTLEIFNAGTDTLQQAASADIVRAPEWTPDKRFLAKDYQNLSTMEEFFREVVVISTVENTPAGKRLRMFEGDEHNLNHLPVRFAVDDVFEADAEKVLNMKFSEVERVDMFNKRSTIKNQLDSLAYRGGVMAIYTKAGLIKSLAAAQKKTVVEGLSRSAPFITPVREDRTPDLRRELYWNGNVRIPSSGRFEITFPLSDDVTTYRVRAQGVNEKGEPVFGEGTIVVGR